MGLEAEAKQSAKVRLVHSRRGDGKLSPEDYERLHYALQRRSVDLKQSLFGPKSLTWRINREAALLIGGGRALLLQVAHPLVAAGVAAHSNFKTEPLQRLQRTLELTLTIAFADAQRALGAVRTIERVHAHVHGVLNTKIGPFPRGTRYDANNPELLFWVHATLVDTSILVYERFVAPLERDVRAAYYDESRITARFFGIPEALIPPTLDDFRDYFNAMVRGRTLAVSDDGRDIAASILNPPLPFGVRQVFQAPNLITIGLLPAVVRKRYGYTWSGARETTLYGLAGAIKHALPLLPNALRYFPPARQAFTR